MLDFLKKGILASIGAVVLTKEKIQEATRILVEEGKISTEEAERLTNELIRNGERQWEEISRKFQDSMTRWSWQQQSSDSSPNTDKTDFQDLRARVELLAQRVAVLEEAQRRDKGVVGGY
ncbi:MAG: phasin family protein [Acidobacteriota bacterium]